MVLPEQTFKTGFVSKLEELFGLDLRSLALFRVGLALLIIADLIKRSQDLTAHYTDFGVLPRSPLIEKFLNPWFWSVHLLSGQLLFQALLFSFAGLVALAVLIGYRTRFVTIVSWALLISLHSRNPMVLDAGDVLLRLLLFWGMFLPLGAYYSVDSAFDSSPKRLPERILSGGTVALTLQICFVYWFTALLKSDPIWWKEGSAAYYALSIDQFATRLGHFFLSFPSWLLVGITFTTIWFELLGPLLLFIPFHTGLFRFCAVITFILLHIGFSLGLELGLFPYVCIVTWLVFIPSWFWNALSKHLYTYEHQGLKIYYNRESSFCQKNVYLLRTFLILPGTPFISDVDEPKVWMDIKIKHSWFVVDCQGHKYFKFSAITYLCHISPLFRPLAGVLEWQPLSSLGAKLYTLISNHPNTLRKVTAPLKFRLLEVRSPGYTNVAALALLVCVSFWNFRSLAPSRFEIPRAVRWISFILRIDQRWKMFAPYPSKNDGWYVIPGQLKDGSEIDVFKNGTAVSWEKPSLVSATYRNERWRKYMMNLRLQEYKQHRLYYGRYLCRDWNSQHRGSKQLRQFKIYFMRERTLPNYQPPKVKKLLIWQHSCFKPSKKE